MRYRNIQYLELEYQILRANESLNAKYTWKSQGLRIDNITISSVEIGFHKNVVK